MFIFSLFERLDLPARCGVARGALLSFVHVIAAHYRDNAYHNLWHAADVTHACYLLLRAQLSTAGLLSHIWQRAHPIESRESRNVHPF